MPIYQRKKSKAEIRREIKRRELFPNVSPEDVWNTGLDGWSCVPRTMPIILKAIRELTKGVAADTTYHALWSNSLSEAIVEVMNRGSLIASSGYTGPSSERLWRERMRKLEELGFIEIASGGTQDISTVLLKNPHKVLKKLHQAKAPGLEERTYNTMVEQMAQHGMKDFEEKAAEPAQPAAN